MPRAGKPTARAAALPGPARLAAFEKVRRAAKGVVKVLARLSKIRAARLRELLADSWRFVAPKSRAAKLGAS